MEEEWFISWKAFVFAERATSWLNFALEPTEFFTSLFGKIKWNCQDSFKRRMQSRKLKINAKLLFYNEFKCRMKLSRSLPYICHICGNFIFSIQVLILTFAIKIVQKMFKDTELLYKLKTDSRWNILLFEKGYIWENFIVNWLLMPCVCMIGI